MFKSARIIDRYVLLDFFFMNSLSCDHLKFAPPGPSEKMFCLYIRNTVEWSQVQAARFLSIARVPNMTTYSP